jgi:hypothetical protein
MQRSSHFKMITFKGVEVDLYIQCDQPTPAQTTGLFLLSAGAGNFGPEQAGSAQFRRPFSGLIPPFSALRVSECGSENSPRGKLKPVPPANDFENPSGTGSGFVLLFMIAILCLLRKRRL